MSPSREVVITGVGVVSPIGIGKDAFWSSLEQQHSGVARRDLFAGMQSPLAIAAAVDDFDAKQFIKPRKSLKVMCRQIQMGNVAAVMAMDDARLASGQFDPDRTGVVMGSELYHCELSEMEAVYRSCLADGAPHFDAFAEHAMREIYPLWMLKHLPNMPACHVGIAFDARGHNNTVVAEAASSLLALLEAVDVIARGWADVMLAGGTGSQIELTTMVYHGELEMSHRIDQPQRASRPFDAGRDGMVIGEGAGVVVLESREHAESRGANILAHVRGGARTFGVGSEENAGRALRAAIRGALQAGDVAESDVGHVNAHGRSTIEDDATEAQAIRATLGDVPVTAPKSFFGYLGAGSAVVELIASVLALGRGEVPVTLNYAQPDPACPVAVVHGAPRRPTVNTALKLGRSRSGQTAAVLLAGP